MDNAIVAKARLKPGQPALARSFSGADLQARLILIVAAVCGAVWLSALQDAVRHRETVLKLAERQHDNIARALAEQTARSLQAIDLIMRQAELLDPPGRPSPREQRRIVGLLRVQISGVPQVRDMFLYDPARHLHLSSGPTAARWLDVSDRSYFAAQRDRDAGIYVGEPIVSRTTGDPTFVLSRRLPGAAFRGIVAAVVHIGYFRDFYGSLELGSDSVVDLLRDDGVSLVSSAGPLLSRAPQPLAQAARGMPNARGARAQVRLDDPRIGHALASLCRVPGYPLVVSVARSQSTVLQAWQRDAMLNAARTFAISLLAGILLVAFLRQLKRHERLSMHLHQSQKLEALGTLAGGIAHDFNNILAAILGYAELARQDAPPAGPIRRYVDGILLAANRARDLVARILAFSRPGINTPRPVLLQRVVQDCVELVRPSLPLQVQLDVRVPEQAAVVMGEPAQLHQVLGNLLTNAVQAVGDAGRIEVSLQATEVDKASECHIGKVWPGRYARLQVQDSGAGIAPRDLAHIFDPFFTTKAPGVGTGLGLSLVHASVLEHQGAVVVHSQPGHGTRFEVLLPLSDAAPVSEPVAPAAASGQGQVILVVDDEAELVRLTEEVLAGLGYEPVGCASPRQALELFRAAPDRFDALLTDVRMSGMSGPDLAGEILKIRVDLPVIMMSGFFGAGSKPHPGLAQARAVLQKPLSSAQLAQCLAGVFGAGQETAKHAAVSA